MVLNNDTTDHDDCADASASSSASSSVSAHFDGPLGHGVVIFTEKITGKFISSYNQQDIDLTQDDAPPSSISTPYQRITQASASSTTSSPASVSGDIKYE